MQAIFDFFGSQTGVELLRIADSLLSVVVLVISGRALSNTVMLKKTIGGVVKPGLLRRLLGGKKHTAETKPDLKRDAFQSLTLADKVDMLKDNQELLSLRLGVTKEKTDQRLDRVDPPNRRH